MHAPLFITIPQKNPKSMFLFCYTCAPCYLRLKTESVTSYNYGKLPSMFANYEEYKYEHLSFQAADSA